MSQRLFIVDVEASAPTPATGKMTEFGVVDFESRAWFHGHLWDFTPHPDIPALPVPTEPNPGFSATLPTGSGGTTFDGTRHTIDLLANGREHRVYSSLISWMTYWVGTTGERAVFVSDNPGFDFMWMAYGFDSHHLKNPFGYSSRRIGDLAAGLSDNWRATSSWKKHRSTRHDHNPVHDALGNAEALEHLLRKHNQTF